MIIQQGSDFFDKDGNVIVNNESNVKTLEFIYNMVHVDKIAIPTPGRESSFRRVSTASLIRGAQQL